MAIRLSPNGSGQTIARPKMVMAPEWRKYTGAEYNHPDEIRKKKNERRKVGKGWIEFDARTQAECLQSVRAASLKPKTPKALRKNVVFAKDDDGAYRRVVRSDPRMGGGGNRHG